MDNLGYTCEELQDMDIREPVSACTWLAIPNITSSSLNTPKSRLVPQMDVNLYHVRVQVPMLPRPAMAPYNGYGTLLDSEQNCRLLLPKPPKKDLRKMVNKDGMILRFVSKFYPRSEIGFAVRPPGVESTAYYMLKQHDGRCFNPYDASWHQTVNSLPMKPSKNLSEAMCSVKRFLLV